MKPKFGDVYTRNSDDGWFVMFIGSAEHDDHKDAIFETLDLGSQRDTQYYGHIFVWYLGIEAWKPVDA